MGAGGMLWVLEGAMGTEECWRVLWVLEGVMDGGGCNGC